MVTKINIYPLQAESVRASENNNNNKRISNKLATSALTGTSGILLVRYSEREEDSRVKLKMNYLFDASTPKTIVWKTIKIFWFPMRMLERESEYSNAVWPILFHLIMSFIRSNPIECPSSLNRTQTICISISHFTKSSLVSMSFLRLHTHHVDGLTFYFVWLVGLCQKHETFNTYENQLMQWNYKPFNSSYVSKFVCLDFLCSKALGYIGWCILQVNFSYS